MIDTGSIQRLPYWTSPPMQFSLTQQAILSAGTFQFLQSAGGNPVTPADLANNKNITENSMILIYDFSFAADIPVLDYQQALQLGAGTTDIPNFNLFLKSDAGSPQLKDPIELYNYIDKQQYILALTPKISDNAFRGFFRGSLQQTAALAGLNEINFTINFYAQEIVDDNYIHTFKQNYPGDIHK